MTDRTVKALRKCLQDAQNANHELAEELVDPIDAAETITEALNEARKLLGFGDFAYTGEHGTEDEEE